MIVYVVKKKSKQNQLVRAKTMLKRMSDLYIKQYCMILYDFVISQGIAQNQLHRCYKDSVTSWCW